MLGVSQLPSLGHTGCIATHIHYILMCTMHSVYAKHINTLYNVYILFSIYTIHTIVYVFLYILCTHIYAKPYLYVYTLCTYIH